MTTPLESEGSLTGVQVAALYRVDPRTVTRWARAGRLTWVRTPGGHRRYPAAQFENLLLSDEDSPYMSPPVYDHDGERLLSTAEVARLLRIPADKVHSYLTERGVVPVRVQGWGRRYRETAVRAATAGGG